MQGFSTGAGLAALAFWGFIAAVVVAGIWYDMRKKEAQHETIRRLLESGQPVDEKLMEKLDLVSGDKADRVDRGLKIGGLITLPTAAGLAIFGYILGFHEASARLPLYGVAALVAFVGLGLMIASNVASRWYEEDEKRGSGEL